MSQHFPIQYPVNIMQGVVHDFLDGAPFTEQLCDKVVGTYCAELSAVSYKRNLEFVKAVLERSKHGKLRDNLYYVQTNFEFNDMEVALLVRLLNLCYHTKMIIALNERIIYIPEAYKSYTEDEIRVLVYKTILNKRPSKLQKLKAKLFAKSKSAKRPKITADLVSANSVAA